LVKASSSAARAELGSSSVSVSVEDFGAVHDSDRDDTPAIQAAIDTVESRGGGTVVIGGRYRCGNIVVSGRNVRLEGKRGWLIDGRLTIRAGAANIEVANLRLLNTRGDPESYLVDVSGRMCLFSNVELVKDPIAGGYQMYLRQPSAGCHFSGLKLKGSNGIMVAGHHHLFEDFELESTMSNRVGGDDAFAIKAFNEPTHDITIRNGLIRGFAAIASFGSEIGTSGRSSNYEAFVRNVTVTDVTADRCGSLVFFKPGALIYDWRNGLVDNIRLERLQLIDERGERFTSGLRMIGGRGAIISRVVGRDLHVRARAKNLGVQPTAAIDLSILDGADARFEAIDLQMTFTDPYNGAEHSAQVPGYPVDHIVRVEKSNARRGSMNGISLDVTGRGSRFGGVYVGEGLDGAVTLRRAHLARVGLHPPAFAGGGGIWSDSKIRLGDIWIDSPVLPRFGGRALGQQR
jgi:hypothetical protein